MNQVDYYDAGLRVFGLLGRFDHDGTELPEKEQFKKPQSANWQHTPEWSQEQFDCMHDAGCFETGFGVVVNGLLIVDVDARNGGVESFSKLCGDLGIDLLSESGFAVATGSGNGSMHVYFRAPADTSLVQSHDKYPGIDFKSTGYVVGAGSLHASGQTYEGMHGHPDDITAAPAPLVELLKRPEYHRTTYEGVTLDITDNDIKAMLSYYPNNDLHYDAWVECGMAIHHATNGTGFDIWLEWSSTSDKHDPRSMEKKWHSFGKSARPVTIGTIIHHAKQNGWRSSYDDVVFDTTLEDDGDELDISGIDLKRPPGFVGELAKWINQQSFYPRESFAVAAALNAVGSIGGLRYTDAMNGFTPNLYMLCVAGSSTGKEAIQQCYADCLAAAGISDAMHGAIKSEQEMIRNLIRHQPSYYVIDEFGIFLKKLVNAGSKSGASYLEGVIGLAMSAYTKATSYLPVSGDLKETTKDLLLKEMASCQKAIDENNDSSGRYALRLEQLAQQLTHIKRGIYRPYVTIMGFTTPVTFNDLVSYEMATNGFVSRAMIFDEPETNPRPNVKHKKSSMPYHIEATLAALYNNGDTTEQHRIEHVGDKKEIDTTEDGKRAMQHISEQFWQMAEDAKAQGLEAIPRRGYELVAKISLVLAIPEGIRTIEHIRWSYALVKADIERKMRLAYSNMQKDDDPALSIATKIQSIVTDSDKPVLHSVIINRCRPAKREAVEAVLSKLLEKGVIKEERGQRGAVSYLVS